LSEAGFHAFLPRHYYIESFAESLEELEVHRRCVIEEAKNCLGWPDPFRLSNDEQKQVYRSIYLQKLQAKLDEDNGVARPDLEKRYPLKEAAWRIQYDPCLRRRVLAENNDAKSADLRFSIMIDKEREAFESEVAGHATGLGRVPHTFDESGRFAFLSAV